jgi:CBS domain containing-hemolysin-like protein
MSGLLVFVFLAGLALSFFLSGMEAGVFALSRLRIRHLMRKGNIRARALYGYLENPEEFFWTILVGNTIANLAVVSLGVVWLYQWLSNHPLWMVLALGSGVLVFYAFCELLPKTLFRLYPNRLCLILALPFRVVQSGLKPVIAPMAWLARWLLRWSGGRRFTGHLFASRDELLLVMQESAQSLSRDEQRMINRVLDLQNIKVGQILIPLSEAVMVSVNTPVREVISLARERGFSRLPVRRTDDSRERIVGLIDLLSLLYEEKLDPARPAGEFVQSAVYLDADTRLERALSQMQRTGQRLAIVLGRDRSEVGLVSLQDILRVIFGDVRL